MTSCLLSVRKSRRPGPTVKKKKKKKILKQEPQQKSKSKLKTTKKPPTFSHHAAKPKPLKQKLVLEAKSVPKPKTKRYCQHQTPPPYRPHLGSQSSSDPPVSATANPNFQLQTESCFWSTSRQTTWKKQSAPRSRPPQPKSRTHKKSKTRRMISQYQNMSQPGTTLPKAHPTAQLQSSQPVWDTSVQAAIRVGDWKLLTGDPGHGDWVPPQVDM